MMKKINSVTLIILFFWLIFGCVYNVSACTSQNPVAESATFGSYIVQKDTPVGTVIASTKSVAVGGLTFGNCLSSGTVFTKMVYGAATKSSLKDVYLTNIPGIGIRSKLYGTYAYFNAPPTGTSQGGGATFTNTSGSTVELIAIGPVSSGELTPGPVGVVYFNETPTINSYTVNISGGTINSAECSITNKNINITLDDVLEADLTSVNSTAKPKSFDLGLDCKTGAKVNVKLTGVANTDTSAAGVLQLSNAGGTGVAKGVGIQIIYNNAPLDLNKNIVLITSNGGQEALPFTAQYFQTKSTVTTGSANATATLEVTYQ
ncbi:fimbrial protein [Enterobacteriaceae bacterium Kacie_13]|nr:fimbrial protein [Enterobacteriaceae bacterium Kacie_13]